VVGVVDLATRTSEGLLAMSDRGGASRINVPRAFDADGCIVGLAESLARTNALVDNKNNNNNNNNDDNDKQRKQVARRTDGDSLALYAASARANAALAAHILHRFDLPATEPLLAYFMCSLVETVFHTGHVYVFENHVCFIG
jgi:hypothetical protein